MFHNATFCFCSTDIDGAHLTDKLNIWEKPAFGRDKQAGHAALFVFRPAGDTTAGSKNVETS